MRIYKTEKQDVKICTDIICDKCGKSCLGELCKNYCGTEFNISGNYDSRVFPDDETIRHYDVCEFCINEWMETWPKDYLQIGTILD